MARRRYTPETTIHKLREAEVLQGQGKTIAEVLKQPGVTEQTLYRWCKEYGGMWVDEATRHIYRALSAAHSAIRYIPRPARASPH
jgi:transposase-like protein